MDTSIRYPTSRKGGEKWGTQREVGNQLKDLTVL